MSLGGDPLVSWLAEVYLLATAILAAAGVAVVVLRQPARRLVVARSTLMALLLLAPLAAGARWARSPREGRLAPSVPSSASLPAVAVNRWPGGCCPSPPQPIKAVVPPPIAPTPRFATAAFGPLLERNGIRLAFVVGSGVTVAWLGLGAIASARLRARTFAAPERLRAMLARIVGEARRPPRLVICAQVAHPVAIGLFRPTIVLPAWFAETEPEGRIEAALTHEWAHIQNGDLWLLASSRLLLPLLFAHPLYTWLRRRVRADQEAMADASAAAVEGRIAYAEALLCWARPRGVREARTFAPSLGLWEHSSTLTGRIALLLDREFRVEPPPPRPWRLGVGVATAAVILGLGAALLSSPAPAPAIPDSTHSDAGNLTCSG